MGCDEDLVQAADRVRNAAGELNSATAVASMLGLYVETELLPMRATVEQDYNLVLVKVKQEVG